MWAGRPVNLQKAATFQPLRLFLLYLSVEWLRGIDSQFSADKLLPAAPILGVNGLGDKARARDSQAGA
jgi:hypothetical protein